MADAQEGRFFHGYYGRYCYLPLYCFCGNIPLWAQSRTSGRDGSDGTVEALEKIVAAIRKRFGRDKKILVRGDSGFAREAIMGWCEARKKVFYCLGLARNKRLQEELEEEFAGLEAGRGQQGEEGSSRRFKDFTYRTLESWGRCRRVVGKAELTHRTRSDPHTAAEELPTQSASTHRQVAAVNQERFGDR